MSARKDLIDRLTERFLGWSLPPNFNPDGGISFEKIGNKDTPHQYVRQPSGTNLLDATQARAMFEDLFGDEGPLLDLSVENLTNARLAMRLIAAIDTGPGALGEDLSIRAGDLHGDMVWAVTEPRLRMIIRSFLVDYLHDMGLCAPSAPA